MHARDLMTTAVVTVTPDTPVAAIAALLASRGISAVPVVDPDGRMVGIVTEADLVRRLAGDDVGQKKGWLAGIATGRARAEAERYVRLHGGRASDVMVTDLVTVQEDTPAREMARLMEERRVKRLPVLREGRLAGIVSRADLLSLAFRAPAAGDEQVSDERIRRAIEAAMREQPWADAYLVYPSVAAGVVTFHGFSRSPSVPKALRVLAERVPGVKGVDIQLAAPPPFVLGVP
jgi:CBS domain-containing protein